MHWKNFKIKSRLSKYQSRKESDLLLNNQVSLEKIVKSQMQMIRKLVTLQVEVTVHHWRNQLVWLLLIRIYQRKAQNCLSLNVERNTKLVLLKCRSSNLDISRDGKTFDLFVRYLSLLMILNENYWKDQWSNR
mgnify:CR=1 FL=1